MASLPGEWQIRFMAYYRHLQSCPWLSEKLRNFYRMRRRHLIAQLNCLAEIPLFEQVYIDDDATVYNWSWLSAGEDAFSVFEKTGIAGVPGSGLGIPHWTQKKLDRVSLRVDGPVEVEPDFFDVDVCLVHSSLQALICGRQRFSSS